MLTKVSRCSGADKRGNSDIAPSTHGAERVLGRPGRLRPVRRQSCDRGGASNSIEPHELAVVQPVQPRLRCPRREWSLEVKAAPGNLAAVRAQAPGRYHGLAAMSETDRALWQPCGRRARGA